MIITLTAAEQARAAARAARAAGVAARVADRAGVERSTEKRVFGASCEIAAARALGVRLTRGVRARYDVDGYPVHIRGSRVPGRFALQPAEMGHVADTDYVVAVFGRRSDPAWYDVAGWISGMRARAVASLESVGGHPAALWISRSVLLPLDGLLRGLGLRAEPPAPPSSEFRMPIGSCFRCKAFIYDPMAMVHVVLGPQIVKRAHREPCWADEVPE